MVARIAVASLSLLSLVACERQPQPREYALHGQVLAVRAAEREVVIRHGDIKGFMPGMTMPFRVKDTKWLDGLAAGEIVDATLVVHGGDAWLSRISRTGRREPLPPDAEAAPRRLNPPLEPGAAVPDAAFTDQDGRPFQVASLRGKPWAVTFVYTRCPLPTFCPALDLRFQGVQRAIAGDARLEGARLLSVSIDPAYDRPPVLAAHAGRLHADPGIWRFVTGDAETIDRFGERFGLTVVRGEGRPEDFVHSLKTAVVDREGRLRRIYSGTEWTSGELANELREAAR